MLWCLFVPYNWNMIANANNGTNLTIFVTITVKIFVFSCFLWVTFDLNKLLQWNFQMTELWLPLLQTGHSCCTSNGFHCLFSNESHDVDFTAQVWNVISIINIILLIENFNNVTGIIFVLVFIVYCKVRFVWSYYALTMFINLDAISVE